MKFKSTILIVGLFMIVLCTTSFAPPAPSKDEIKEENSHNMEKEESLNSIGKENKKKPYKEEFLPAKVFTKKENSSSESLTDESIISLIIKKLQPKLSNQEAKNISKLIITNSKKGELDPYWMLSMMYTESRFDTNAISKKGARGLMQLIPSTAKIYGVSKEQLHEPSKNIEAGFKYYIYLKNKYGDRKIATIAYNQGQGNVNRGTYNTKYYKKVKSVYNRVQKEKERIEEELK